MAQAVTIWYTNHRGDAQQRRILPGRLWFGSTEWHPEPQWLLDALDLDRQVQRIVAMRDIASWAPGGPEPSAVPLAVKETVK